MHSQNYTISPTQSIEIFSFAEEPWSEYSDEECIQNICCNQCLKQPLACPDEMFEVVSNLLLPSTLIQTANVFQMFCFGGIFLPV